MATTDMDSPVSIENEEQLWSELDQVVATQCPAGAHETIDDALRTWLYLTSQYRDEFSQSEDDVAGCSHMLLHGNLFDTNPDYVRTQMIYSLLQEDETGPLYAIASFLLLDGRVEEATFRRMVDEGCFLRLLELINGRKEHDPPLHRLLLELLFEMARIVKLNVDDLVRVDDAFVTYLFQLIEGFSEDIHDPYHYPIIRVLLVLNEQYMVASAEAVTDPTNADAPLTNRVVKCLSLYGPLYRTFGENIILLLNRETETASQLLILKLLYLLFTTKATYEYFYTNDLRVLLDIIIRNLHNLPEDPTMKDLRHTYLRVLYPLLAHSQLNQPPYYKKEEIHKLLKAMTHATFSHFAEPDETVLRLVDRVSKVKWLSEDGIGAAEIARKFLGISLSPTDAASSISVVDVAAVTEKPGVLTPSRKDTFAGETVNGDTDTTAAAAAEAEMKKEEDKVLSKPTRPKKALPEVPKHRHGTPVCPVIHAVHANGDGKVKKAPPKLPPPRKSGRRGLREAVSQTFEPQVQQPPAQASATVS